MVQVRPQQRLDRTRHQQVRKQNEVTFFAPGDWGSKRQKQIQKTNGSRDSDERLRYLFEFMEEFIDKCFRTQERPAKVESNLKKNTISSLSFQRSEITKYA